MYYLKDFNFTEINTRTRRSLVANPQACTGCRTCEMTCALFKTGTITPDRSRIRIERFPFEGRYRPHVCRQCSMPHCMRACPEQAVGISEKNGVVLIRAQKCTGCGLCVQACPYGMIVLDRSVPAKAVKCDLCGGKPQCLQSCPMNALGVVEFKNREPK